MIDELNIPKTKYQCICSDCKHIFVSDKSPLPCKSAFSRLFCRQGMQTDASTSSKHSALAFSAESLKAEKSPIHCPKCGSQYIMLGGSLD